MPALPSLRDRLRPLQTRFRGILTSKVGSRTDLESHRGDQIQTRASTEAESLPPTPAAPSLSPSSDATHPTKPITPTKLTQVVDSDARSITPTSDFPQGKSLKPPGAELPALPDTLSLPTPFDWNIELDRPNSDVPNDGIIDTTAATSTPLRPPEEEGVSTNRPALSTLTLIPVRSRDVAKVPQPIVVRRSKTSVVIPLVKTCLVTLGEILNDLNLPGASACKLIVKAVDNYEEMQSNINALNSLRMHCDHITSVITKALNDKKGSALSHQLKAALKRFDNRLEELVAPCEGEQTKDIFIRILMSGKDAARITEIFDDVGRLMAAFVLEITLTGHITLDKAMRSLENRVLAASIMSLPRVGAAYDDYRTLNQKRTVCLTGTRTALLEAIGHWAVARDEKPIYLLTGHAGYGKSTIVRTVSERLDNLHILGASFFFSRDDNQSKSTSHFFSTLAYQLCVFSEAFAQAIGNALKSLKTLDAVEKSPASQLMHLIVGPLKRFSMISPNIVIVVDALDECEDFESSEGESWGRDIWDGLATLVEELPFVRVFLTSRPHQHLSTLVANNPRLYINNTSVEASDPDIKRYLKCKLIKEAPHPLGRYHVSESQISHLARMAAGLFIIAATAVRFIMDPRAISPSERIKALIEGSMSGPTSPNNL